MKRYLLGAFFILVTLVLVAGVIAIQTGNVETKVQLRAGDGGGPIPTCRPGANCGPEGQLREMAGDGGGPIPTCRPGANCGPDSQDCARWRAMAAGQSRHAVLEQTADPRDSCERWRAMAAGRFRRAVLEPIADPMDNCERWRAMAGADSDMPSGSQLRTRGTAA